jgi:hypothetical protein
MIINKLRGLYTRAFSAPLAQAAHPTINAGIVIELSKSPDKQVRNAAAQNLIGRLSRDELGSAAVLDLLTHPVYAIASAAADHIIDKAIEISDLYVDPFIAVLRADPSDLVITMAQKTFPQKIVLLLSADSDQALAVKAFEALTARIKSRTIEPRLLQFLEQAIIARLLEQPRLAAEDRVSILEGAITVSREVEQGWENIGHYMFQPGNFQSRYALVNQPVAAALLKVAFGATPDPIKHIFLEKLQASEKLGRFIVCDSKANGWDSWQFTPQMIKEGKIIVYDALGPTGPSKLTRDCY